MLTARQIEVFKGMAEGLAYKEIGARLNISLRTVNFHISAIYAAYGVHSRAELLRKFGHFEISLKWVPNKQTKKEKA